MKPLKFTEYLLPAHWASALINGDYSGLDYKEADELDAWVRFAKPGYCVGCSDEAEFCGRNDATNLGGDCLVFTFAGKTS